MLNEKDKKKYIACKSVEYFLEDKINGLFNIQSNGDGTFSIWHDPDSFLEFNPIDESIYTGTGEDFKTIKQAIEVLEKHFLILN